MSGNEGSNAVQKVIPALLEVYTSEVAFRKQLETLKKYLLINPPKVNSKTKLEKDENGLEYFIDKGVKYFKGENGIVYFKGDNGKFYWTGYSVEDKAALIKAIDDYLKQSVIVLPDNIQEVINSDGITAIGLLKDLDEKFASINFRDSLFKLIDDCKKFFDYVSESSEFGEKSYTAFAILPFQRSMRFVMPFEQCAKTFYEQNDIGSLRIALKLRDQGAHVAVKANEVQRIYDIIKYLKKYEMSYAQSGSDIEDSPKRVMFKKAPETPITIELQNLERNIIKILKAHLQAGLDGNMDLPNLNLLQKINKEYLEHRDKVEELISKVNADQKHLFKVKEGLDLLNGIYKFRAKEIEEGLMKASIEEVAIKKPRRLKSRPFGLLTKKLPKPVDFKIPIEDALFPKVPPQNFIKNLTRLFELRVAMQMIINATEKKRDGIQLEKLSSTDETKYKILYKDGSTGTITLGRDGSLSMQIDAPFKVAVKLRNQLKALVEEALKVARQNQHPNPTTEPPKKRSRH